jgi:hypothetical protein
MDYILPGPVGVELGFGLGLGFASGGKVRSHNLRESSLGTLYDV